MKNQKENIRTFFIWLRNGSAFAISWCLLLLLAGSYLFHYQTISIHTLSKMVLLIIGGVFIFNTFFTNLFIRKWSFLKRLTGFMLCISLYECFAFYSLGIFTQEGTLTQWLIFAAIVLVLYFSCIAIYCQYSKKQGALYTQALLNYQQKRSNLHEK